MLLLQPTDNLLSSSVLNCVIMAVYRGDRPNFLLAAIDSTLAAPSADRLLIGIDGPIGADLEDILARSSARHVNLRTLRFAANRGLACVLNDLIDVALSEPSCEFVSRMDADDIVCAGRFSRQIEYLHSHPITDVVGCWAWLIDDHDVLFSEIQKPTSDRRLKHRLSFDAPFVHPTVMFRSAVLRRGHRYPTDTVRFEDVAMWANMAASGCEFSNVPAHLLHYRHSLHTADRRLGFQKALSELRVRAGYLVRMMPWRIDLFVIVTAVAIAKLTASPSVFNHLYAARRWLIRLADRTGR